MQGIADEDLNAYRFFLGKAGKLIPVAMCMEHISYRFICDNFLNLKIS